MKLDHKIKIRVLDGIDDDLIAGIQIKETGTAEKITKTRLSIFSKREEDGSEAAPGKRKSVLFQKRSSIFRRGPDEQSSGSSSGASSNRRSSLFQRQSISHLTKPLMVEGGNFINVVSSVKLKKENIGKEHEFQLTDSFYSVFIFLYKKKSGLTQLLADLELPDIVFTPDEIWHEQTLALKDQTYTDKKGHQFIFFPIINPFPCYHCNTVMCSHSSMPELEFFKCDGCGILCHGNCHKYIVSTCSKVLRLRIAYSYSKEPIYETAKYKPLLDGLFNGNMRLLDLFSRVTDNLDESAFHIVKLLETFTKRKALEVVSGLCTTEMSLADDYHQIFQQPSLALKVIELLMKHISKDFLIFTFQKSIAQIILEDFDCELDSNRMSAEKQSLHISEKLSNLENYLEQLFRAITTSPKSFPFTLRCILAKIYQIASSLYPQEPTAGYIVSNNILFRKILIPALMAPENFGIVVPPFHKKSQRTMIVLCKAMQRISNLDFFDNDSDINFQKMNRIIGSYHPIITIYMNELIKVNLEPDESKNLNIKDVAGKDTKITKIPWYQKLITFCFPRQSMAASSSDLDIIFKEKPQQTLDWENLDTPLKELISKTIDPDLHIAAIGRLLLRHGEKLVLSCNNDKEISLAYDGLGCASSLRGKQREQMDDFRKMAILRIQQQYQSQFYVDEDDMENSVSEDALPSKNSYAFKRGIKGQSEDSMDLKIEARSTYYLTSKSSFKPNVSIVDESIGILSNFVESKESIQNGAENQKNVEENKINQIKPETQEYLDTPLIGMAIFEKSSREIFNDESETGQISHDAPPVDDEIALEPIRPAEDTILLQKRKSLMTNLDSILRPKGESTAADTTIPFMINKEKNFSKFIPNSG